MKPQFYYLERLYSDKFVEIFESGNTIEIKKCPKCGVVTSVEKYPLKVHLGGNGLLANYYSYVSLNVIDLKVQKVFAEKKINGYFLRDVEFIGWFTKRMADPTGRRLKREVTDLKEIVVTGRCGFLRHLDGTMIKKCDLCDSPYINNMIGTIGLSVDLNQWDGSDIFAFDNWERNIIVTQKVKDLAEKEKFTNMVFTPIEEIDL